MLAGGGAWSLRLGETELKEDDYRFLRKFLDATKANVFFAKGIIFVEGDGENILLPDIARLLRRPLENYGVSIVKYDNSGSWKRFTKIFLCSGKDDNASSWNPTKVCVLRDLDLWPNCAEKKGDGSNPHGFLEKKHPTKGKTGNLHYWEQTDDAERCYQIQERIKGHKIDGEISLERQNVKVYISNRWTFEFCLARYGLYSECCDALSCDQVDGTDDEKATSIQKLVSETKTDFAYRLSELLEKQLAERIEAEINELDDKQKENRDARFSAETKVRIKFAIELKDKLPPYIVEAIEYVTAPISGTVPLEERVNAT